MMNLRNFVLLCLVGAHAVTSQDASPPHKFSLAIYTNLLESQDIDVLKGGTYWRLVGLKEDWTIEKDGHTLYEDSVDPPAKSKWPGKQHILQGVYTWDHSLEARSFWIDRNKEKDAPFRGMTRCTVRPPEGVQKPVYLYISLRDTVAWVDDVDKETLQPGWLRCTDGQVYDRSFFSSHDPVVLREE